MSKRNERAQVLAYDWIYWFRTRRFLGVPNPRHILAVLSEPDTSGEPPDAPMSAEIAAFHIGVIGLPESLGVPFLRIYCGYPKLPIKKLAYDAGITDKAYYDRAHKGADEAIRGMNRALNIVENMGLLRPCSENYRKEHYTNEVINVY